MNADGRGLSLPALTAHRACAPDLAHAGATTPCRDAAAVRVHGGITACYSARASARAFPAARRESQHRKERNPHHLAESAKHMPTRTTPFRRIFGIPNVTPWHSLAVCRGKPAGMQSEQRHQQEIRSVRQTPKRQQPASRPDTR